ncbi:hypothetical protein [Bradyrhizobium sp. BWC-3-1]|uniref:hypothetical protein n=1 Tax=Bradyrhizobium sp. BWC-3-1 TaxID=3080012 RepID=UPI00293F53AE|nr:hypothetical protein [Bradyrhizobium sp. BWC-3-1]WOH56937.1 hypothetical protein RX329_32540 [Bradyrhizobium sp. BWC-3-1]
MEGPAIECAVVLQFPSMQDAKDWYNTPPIRMPFAIGSRARSIASSLLRGSRAPVKTA